MVTLFAGTVAFIAGFLCGVAAVLTTTECATGPAAAPPRPVPANPGRADLHPAAVYGEHA